jgi:chromosome segregation ATPase
MRVVKTTAKDVKKRQPSMGTPAQQSRPAEAVGPKSEAVAQEVEELVEARAPVAQEVEELTRTVASKQATLDDLRAQDLLGKVNKDQIAAFERELGKLQARLDKAHSTLAGLDRKLEAKRQDMEAAQADDAQAAVLTKEMATIQKGLDKNGQALEKAQRAFLGVLEPGATELVQNAGPHLEKWQRLIEERRALYARHDAALGNKAGPGSDPDKRMRLDPLTKLFADNYDVQAVLDLAEMLRPLFTVEWGWPAVRRPGQ